MWHFVVIFTKIRITEGRRMIRCKLTSETGLWWIFGNSVIFQPSGQLTDCLSDQPTDQLKF